MSQPAPSKYLIWIDLEMTGLNPEQDRIVEIATLITDANLNEIAVGPNYAIHQTEDVLSLMDDWVRQHHTQSGLVERIRASHISEMQAQADTLEFLKRYLAPNQSPMCGNSVYQDRRFLVKYMPKLEQFFHYRNIDVSTVKELARRWRPEIIDALEKESKHLALDDIRESVEELKLYRDRFFKFSH